jgi:hypothetical protein
MDQIDRQVFMGDLSDEACTDIDLLSGELAKSEVALQESLGLRPISANLRGRDQDRFWWLEKSVPQAPKTDIRFRGRELAKVARYEVLG